MSTQDTPTDTAHTRPQSQNQSPTKQHRVLFHLITHRPHQALDPPHASAYLAPPSKNAI